MSARQSDVILSRLRQYGRLQIERCYQCWGLEHDELERLVTGYWEETRTKQIEKADVKWVKSAKIAEGWRKPRLVKTDF